MIKLLHRLGIFVFILLFTTPSFASTYRLTDVYESDIDDSKQRLYVLHYALDYKAVSTLLIGPSGKMMIFDVGRCPGDADEIYAKVEHVSDQLDSNSPSYFNPSLDKILISHDHSDHNGDKYCNESITGLDTLLSHTGFDSNDVEWHNDFDPGETWVFDQDTSGHPVTITVLAANGYIFGESSRILDSNDKNTRSLVLLVTYKDFSYFIGGDLTGGGYRASVSTYQTQDLETAVAGVVDDFIGSSMDVVQVNHHGSSTSSNATFLSTLFPSDNEYRNAIINVSERYTCLPEEDTVDRILSYINYDSSDTYGHAHLWQTQQGGSGDEDCDSGVRSEVNNKHTIENTNVWIRTNGEAYSIRSVAGSGHKHSYDAIPLTTSYPNGVKTLIKNQAATRITGSQPWHVVW